jgi:hypothetical protein
VEKVASKLMPWVPLMIAAGYFLYLTLSWQRYTNFLEDIEKRIDARLVGLVIVNRDGNSHPDHSAIVPGRDRTDADTGQAD